MLFNRFLGFVLPYSLKRNHRFSTNLGVSVGVSDSDLGVSMTLTISDVKNAKAGEKNFKLADSGGLFLLVTKSGSKSW
ncbi:hypothetical protein BH11PSE6_BH11PSE6_09650 [soil metagenome]